jgi:DNA-binding transcriptional LysR family regulator
MTQPAMSQHLAALEAEVGEPLFTRTSRKMFPTERGKELYTQLVPLIEALEETSRSFNATSSPTLPIVRIGTAHEFFREKIAPYIQNYKMRVIAHYGIASSILELLMEDKLDIIVTSQKVSSPGIEFIPYIKEEFVVVAPIDFIDEDLDEVKQLEAFLCSQTWISYGHELPIIRRFWREHFQKRPQIQPKHILPDLHSILSAVENGTGISILPTYMLTGSLQANKIRIIGKPLMVTNDLYFAYKIKNRNMPYLKMLIEAIKGSNPSSH